MSFIAQFRNTRATTPIVQGQVFVAPAAAISGTPAAPDGAAGFHGRGGGAGRGAGGAGGGRLRRRPRG